MGGRMVRPHGYLHPLSAIERRSLIRSLALKHGASLSSI
jgi:hypothetical protein